MAVWLTTATTLAPFTTPPVAAVPAAPTQVAPACFDVDPADVLAWWRGEDHLRAEIGPDLSGATGFADGIVARGFDLDGSDILEVAGFPSVSSGVTVEAWIKPQPEGRVQAILSRWQFASADDGARAFALLLNRNGDLLWMTDERTLRRPVEMSASTPQLLDGGFHHVAATWSQSEIAVYVDGAIVASQPSQGGTLNAAADAPFRAGSSGGRGDPFFFTGVLDEPAVYGRALSAAEIAALHGAGAGGKCPNWSDQTRLAASDAADFDHYGAAVAVDRDTVVVGASTTDGAGNGSGSAYVHVRDGSSWTEQAELAAADAAPGDQFGVAVAVDGDTAVAGAYEDDDAGGGSGAAYVFTRSGTTWAQEAKLTAADAAPGDHFGWSVGLDGDTLVVGAYDDDAGRGAAYVFTRTGTTWVQQAKLTAADGTGGDALGRSVAVDGDTVVAGAPFDDHLGLLSGSAYAFARTGTAWSEQAKLVGSDTGAHDQFGIAVDVDADTAVIGSDIDDAPGADTGSAFVFARTATAWTQEAKLEPAEALAQDQLGWSVAVSGSWVLLGAPLGDHAGPSSGSVYAYRKSGMSWWQEARLTAADAGSGDGFGWSVAIDGPTAVTGAAFQTLADERGAAYVFDR